MSAQRAEHPRPGRVATRASRPVGTTPCPYGICSPPGRDHRVITPAATVLANALNPDAVEVVIQRSHAVETASSNWSSGPRYISGTGPLGHSWQSPTAQLGVQEPKRAEQHSAYGTRLPTGPVVQTKT